MNYLFFALGGSKTTYKVILWSSHLFVCLILLSAGSCSLLLIHDHNSFSESEGLIWPTKTDNNKNTIQNSRIVICGLIWTFNMKDMDYYPNLRCWIHICYLLDIFSDFIDAYISCCENFSLPWLANIGKNQSKVGRRWRLKLIALRRLKLKEECKFQQNSSFSGWLYCPEEILKDTNVKKSFSWRLRKPMLCSYYGENLWKVVQEQKLNANAYEDGDLGKSILLLSWLWFSLIICLYSNSLYK